MFDLTLNDIVDVNEFLPKAPYNDTSATSGFIGITPTTTKSHMARALLESLAFRVQQLLNILQTETDVEFDHIKYADFTIRISKPKN